jgi:predicted dehydrogenase
VRTVSDFDALVREGVQATTVSTPPDQHLDYYEKCFAARVPFFSEANVLTPSASWFEEREAASGVRSYPSATWQFYPLFGVLRQQLREPGMDSVNSVHYHYGGYLPLWHPWEEYDDFYAGRRPAVGAAREMVPFELEWLRWVFGRVRGVCGAHDQRSAWRTPIDDSYFLLLEFESGLRGTLLVELHQVAPFRLGRVSCRDTSFTLDMAAHELRRYDRANDSWRIFKPSGLRSLGSFDFEQIYLAEIKAFVDALEQRTSYPKSWSDDRHLSDVLYAVEESQRRRAWVNIHEVEAAYDGCMRFLDEKPARETAGTCEREEVGR